MPTPATAPDAALHCGRLLPPPRTGAAGLTSWATDDLRAEPWVTLFEQPQPYPPAAFWFVVNQMTVDHHWNRTIYAQAMLRSEHVDITTGDVVEDPYSAPPSPHTRVHALRRLSRKTPAPIGGSDEAEGRAYDAYEWTCQWVEEEELRERHATEDELEHAHEQHHDDVEPRRHVACFGLCIPDKVVTDDNPRALTYWPFQYPKARCYRFVYERRQRRRASGSHDIDAVGAAGGDINGNGSGEEDKRSQEEADCEWVLRYDVVPLGDEARSPRQFETLVRHARPAAMKMVKHVCKRMRHFDVELGASTYVKRVAHDRLVEEERFRRWYDGLKVRHAPQIQHWLGTPGLLLKPYEELSIAAYLCALWEAEREDEGLSEWQTFVDVGCGNGLLVYLLLAEGHTGVGCDLQKRPIWDLYPSDVRNALNHTTIDPRTFDCAPYDWIIGNHSDELSPWVPVMAARAQHALARRPVRPEPPHTLDGEMPPNRTLRRAYPRFLLIPCCFYDFDGRKLAFGHTRRTIAVRSPHGMGKYEQYYRWIDKIMRTFGFTVEYENLRIPSTKYVSLVGRFVQYEERITAPVIREMTSLVTLDAEQSRM